MPRYIDTKLFFNDTEHYRFLKKKRGIKNALHYGTPVMRHPSVSDRARARTTTLIWSYGDRFYQLAQQYYSDVRYWWVIAWWNGYPTEADIFPGDVIRIPLDISEALEILGA
jgi:nucleoid-associated protein YgaU